MIHQEYGTGAESDTIVMSTLAAEQRPVGPHGPVQTASTPTLLSPVVMPPEVKEILTSVLSGSSKLRYSEIQPYVCCNLVRACFIGTSKPNGKCHNMEQE